MGVPRLLVIFGSGETSPTMAGTHRRLLARLGPSPVPAVLLDTPFGFQANADEIVARTRAYFRESVGQEVELASVRSTPPADAVAHEAALSRLRAARYVFAGPGSPSYAVRHWKATRVPDVLAEKLGPAGGCLSFASAAALTLGVATVPVYEIYKVGQEPHWLEGLNLLALAGLNAAVVPHFDNAEGGTHDTRYCYLGEERLARMEELLPPGAFVLGVDEHTGLVLDLDEGSAGVVGRGGVTVRRDGRSSTVPSGSTVAIADLRALAGRVGSGAGGGATRAGAGGGSAGAAAPGPRRDRTAGTLPLTALEEGFVAALAAGDAMSAVRCLLDLHDRLWDPQEAAGASDEAHRGHDALRSMAVRLAELAQLGVRDVAGVVAPFVEALLERRAAARREGRWEEADALRDRLAALGVEVRDTAQGATWRLLS